MTDNAYRRPDIDWTRLVSKNIGNTKAMEIELLE